jgi:two-component system phosphate regulon sensor histidine kinase PhoR
MPAPIDRIWQSRWAIVTLAIVVCAFVLGGDLSPPLAVIGFAVVCAAMLLAGPPAPSTDVNPLLQSASPRADLSALQGVLDALPDPVVAIDLSSVVVAFNSKAAAIAPALQVGDSLSLRFRMPAVIAAVRRAIASGDAQRAEFTERSRAERWYEAHINPALLSLTRSDSPTHFLLTFHDLTQARRIEQMRADFVANASHELRTPLAAVSGFIDTLRGAAKSDAAARERFLAIMQVQAERMGRLIDDLLSLSRIELREHLTPDTPIELTSIIRQVIDSLQPRAQERGVEISVTAPAEPLMLCGDRDELIRVFENLVENALKYAASGKRVDIRLESCPDQGAANGEAKVLVRDYGPGIAPEHLPRLTERFYRVDVEQSRAVGGTGLGLALVKHILNRHGGRLTIESSPGAGSTFTVALPLTVPAT